MRAKLAEGVNTTPGVQRAGLLVWLLLLLEALASPGSELLHPLDGMSPRSEAAWCPPAFMFSSMGTGQM